MTRVPIREFFFILVCAAASCADTTLVDKQLDYRVYLPDNWVREVYSDSQHNFVDTTYFYPGLLSLRRYTIDTAMYKTAADWTQAYFLAYKLSVQYSVDPSGVVLYSNNDTTVKQGSLQAAEAYSIFFSTDTAVGSWSEYIRFTACGQYGYELYAIGDTADMAKNIGVYAALLQGIVLAAGDPILSPRMFRRNAIAIEKTLYPLICDALGRRIRTATLRAGAAGLYLRKNNAPALLVR
ncbi:MAG TPA: hypothetical protein VLX68_09160 [Chitinivibrionales bacterium]|nr:hypothetical protein [Chitinivibrionales bacterium]